MIFTKRVLGTVLMAALVLPTVGRAATFSEMGRWVPSDANVVVAVDVEKALQSPLAKERFWAATLQLRYSEKQGRIMPSAEKQLMAAYFDGVRDQTLWEVLLIDLAALPSSKDIASIHGSKVERIEGLDVIPTRRGGYAVRIDNDFVAVRTPGNRQAVTRWIRESDKRTAPGVSQFLRDSLAQGNVETTFLVAAVDMEGMLSAESIRPQMGNLRSVKKANLDLDQAAKVIAGLRGVVIRAATGAERMQGTLEMEFSQSPVMFDAIAGQLVVEMLAAAGLDMDEVNLKDFQVALPGNKIVLKGPMSGKNLARLATLVTVAKPVPPAADESSPGAAAATQPADPATASRNYFRTISTYIDEMRRVREFGDLEGAAVFIEKCAKKIDNTPILNVDADLLKWSDFVSASLREASYQLRSANLEGRKAVLANTNVLARVDSRDYDYSGDYWIDYRYTKKYLEHEKTLATITAKVSGREAARAVLKNLDDEMLKIRRAMTLKYKAEF